MKLSKLSNGTKILKKSVVGNIRQTQAITSFGIGSIIDFVDVTVMLLGTDYWTWANPSEDNPYRINNKNLENLLGVKYFIRPKTEKMSGFIGKTSEDMEAVIFPKMLYCQKCKRLIDAKKRSLDKGKIKCTCGNILIPAGFVAVCPNGHIEDFPFSWWVHSGDFEGEECENPKLRMFYTNNKSDLNNLWIKCDTCGKMRSMRGAFAFNALSKYKCRGSRPWLGDDDKEDCDKVLRVAMRTESNVYFPKTQSALTIPPFSSNVAKEVQKYLNLFDTWTEASKKNIVDKILSKNEFKNFSYKFVDRLFQNLQNKIGEKVSNRTIVEEEYSAFTQIICEEDDGNFSTHIEEVPVRYNKLIKKIVAVDRLTVVNAMTGFSRLSSGGEEKVAPLSITPKEWLPGIEQKGEGVFIEFNENILNKWSMYIKGRYLEMGNKLKDSIFKMPNFSPQYVALHTFSHLLMRELSNVCGYSLASMKEKIYSTYDNGEEMQGILIYTSSPDADGSLGGLVEQAKKDKLCCILDSMIERAEWCSMDPLCSESKTQGVGELNYAACYSCLLIPETACDNKNILLDRISIVGTQDDKKLGLVGWMDL